jgi:hexokinase
MAALNVSTTVQKELDGIAKLFEVSDDQLVSITKGFVDTFLQGLRVPNQPVVMGPSFVTHVPNGSEKGTFLTLGISWNSIQVAKIDLDGNRSYNTESKLFDLSGQMMKADATVFFDWLANCVATFLKEKSIKSDGLLLGFTFPFAVQKSSLDNAVLLGWSKGFQIKNVVGKNVVELLQTSLDKAKVDVKCVALVNDTVAALLYEDYASVPCIMSAIYGAGTNGSYTATGADIQKLPNFQGPSMMINTEWGAFSQRALLNPNIYDNDVDGKAANPGEYLFQKMTCWFYLGEIARVVLLSLVERSPPLLFDGEVTETLEKHRGFFTYHLFQIEDAESLDKVKELIVECLGYRQDKVSDQDAEITRWVCTLIATRGGRLAACPIAAVLAQLKYAKIGEKTAGSGGPLRIVADGELFIGSKLFESRLKESIASILGENIMKRLEFHMATGGATVGGALTAYNAAKGA